MNEIFSYYCYSLEAKLFIVRIISYGCDKREKKKKNK